MTICDGDVFVGSSNNLVYVDAEEGSGAGGGSEDGDDSDNDSDNDSESDNEGGAGGADSVVFQLGPTAEAEAAECIEAGGTWKGFYCEMPMDEHIEATCACYVDGRWDFHQTANYPKCMAFPRVYAVDLCQWPFP